MQSGKGKNKSQQRLVTASSSFYGLGKDHLHGSSAIFDPQSGSTLVFIPDQEPITLSKSEMEDAGIDVHSDRISFNDSVIPLFHEPPFFDINDLYLSDNWAKTQKLRDGSVGYNVYANGRSNIIKSGESVKGIGAITETDNGQLVSEKGGLIPVYPLDHKIILIVNNARQNGGYSAFLNLVKPGDDNNFKNGIPGTFFPAKGNGKAPANFSEINEDDGQLYKTAVFWGIKNNSGYVIGNVRDKESAIEERNLFEAMKTIKSEARMSGFSEKEHPCYDPEIEKRLAFLNNTKTGYVSSNVYSVDEGLSYFKQDGMNKNREKGSGYSPGPS